MREELGQLRLNAFQWGPFRGWGYLRIDIGPEETTPMSKTTTNVQTPA